MYNTGMVEKVRLYYAAPNTQQKEGVLMSEEPKVSKAEIKSYAESHGESVNAFIVRAVNEAITRKI